ncbi:MAG: DoxX family protein, partial [Alistipes sp.]|nr:DoxX family protein [Alistipes sp.]
IPSIFSMLIAFFVVHSGEGFAAKELALIYLVMFLILFRMGAGSYSLDNVIARRMYVAEL